MDRLTLPEPAASLWRRCAAGLEQALGQMERPPERWSIGGGTILAARWGHRQSTDIDLTVPEGTGIHTLDERLGGTLRADMTAAGAVEVTTGKRRHRVIFQKGSIDIAELDARPAAGAASAVTEGHEITVKSTTQILRGKLERALREESPVRDLFDIAVAHHADPDALAEAANMLSEEEIRKVKTRWRLNRHSLEQEARSQLTDISPEYETERRDPVGRAITRLEEARYLAVRIRTTRTGLTIETRTAGRPPRRIHSGFENAAETLERTGMGEFLNQHVVGGFRGMTQPSSAARRSSDSQTTVVDWQQPPGGKNRRSTRCGTGR